MSSAHTLSDPETWIDQHGDYLFRYAMTRLRNSEVAEDIVQETLLAALKAAKSFSGKSTERTWLVGILKHKVVDYIRKAQRERPVTEFETDDPDQSVDDFFDTMGEWRPGYAPGSWDATPAELLERKDFWKVLERCISKMPDRLAQAFTMRMIDHMSSEEICDALNITPTNLWVMLHRSRARLRSCLESNWFNKDNADKN